MIKISDKRSEVESRKAPSLLVLFVNLATAPSIESNKPLINVKNMKNNIDLYKTIDRKASKAVNNDNTVKYNGLKPVFMKK